MNDPKRITIVVLGLVVVCLSAFGIKGHMDSDGYKNQVNYTTAVQATNRDLFNYAVDSQQGRVLASGQFLATGNLAKFDEMTKGFTYVARTRQHYTMHTSLYRCGKSTCTRVYYTWDDRETDSKYADKVTLYGREYNASLFNFGHFTRSTNACGITAKNTNTGFFSTKHGCENSWLSGEYYYPDNDNRYYYAVVPTRFTATFLASTYATLKPFNESRITLQDKNIGQIIKDVGKYKLIGFWVLVVILIVLSGLGIFVAYRWVMNDGIWSLNQ